MTAAVAASAVIALAATAPAAAQSKAAEPARAKLDVVSARGDTVPIVRQVTITRDGIRVQAGDRVIVREGNGRGRRAVDIRIEGEDTVRHIVVGHSRRSGEMVSMFQDAEVPAGRTVTGEVVTIFGDVRVHGEVESDVVAVMGSVTLGDSARVGGDVIAVGGTIHASPTAEIQGESVALPLFGRPRWAPWLPLAAGVASLVLFLVLGALVALLFPERLGRMAATASRRTVLSLVLGVLSIPLLPVVFLLLLITVIGIPVAILLLFLYPVAAFVGYAASCALIGARIRGRSVTEASVWPSALLGLAFVGLFFLVGGALTSVPGDAGVLHVVGLVFLGVGMAIGTVSVLLGLGALFLSRLGEPPRPPKAAAAPAISPLPPAPATPAPAPPAGGGGAGPWPAP